MNNAIPASSAHPARTTALKTYAKIVIVVVDASGARIYNHIPF